MLTFAKLSLISFIYKLVKTYSILNETVSKIYDKYLIERGYIYHALTDTDTTCLKRVFVSNPKSNIRKKEFRDIIFQVIIASKIYNGSIFRTNTRKKLTQEKKTFENV